MKPEGDPVQMNWIIQFYPKIGLDGTLMGTSQTKKYKCIGSNMVNHAQDWSWVKIFFDLPNKHIPNKGCQYLIRSPLVLGEDCQHQERDERETTLLFRKVNIEYLRWIWSGRDRLVKCIFIRKPFFTTTWLLSNPVCIPTGMNIMVC